MEFLDQFTFDGQVHLNLHPKKLSENAVARNEAILHKSGAIVIDTRPHTGRAPKDNYKVVTQSTESTIDWNESNQRMSSAHFDQLYNKTTKHLGKKVELFVFDGYVGAHTGHTLKVRVITPSPVQALFAHHLFIRPSTQEMIPHVKPSLTIFYVSDCKADPKKDGTQTETYIVSNYERGIVLIGGTKYLGEMKKSAFTAMNYYLPDKQIFPMHCSANMGVNGDTALFFGLSGTGKTTLSADPKRRLIGDDEHGWSRDGIWNFEGGCYAKTIHLSKKSEPQIWHAVHKSFSILENVVVQNDGSLNFDNDTKTENTRAAYPLEYIAGALPPEVHPHPTHILFLTADATGVLPAVAKLDTNAALFHFLSGYTSKIPGTERGVEKPKRTFSACFGQPFLPRPPTVYARLLEKYLKMYNVKVYLVNTGWQGGSWGQGGKRISIEDTRKIVWAILDGQLDHSKKTHDPIFNLEIPTIIQGIDSSIFNPRSLWKNKKAFDNTAKELAVAFRENIKKFSGLPQEILSAGPTA